VTALQKVQWSTVLIVILIVISSWLGIVWGFWKLSDFLSYIPQFLIGAIFVVIFWGVGQNIKKALGKKEQTPVDKIPPYDFDPIYRNLAVYYHRIKGVSDTPDSSQQRYLADGSKGMAYLIRELPDWLAPAIKNHKMEWCPFDNDKLLTKFINTKFLLIDSNPNPESVGLTYADGKLIEDKRYSKLLSKLAGRKLDDLQIAIVKRRHFLSFVTRTLLVDFSAKHVWLAPPYYYLLEENGIIYSETYGMYFWESCKCWSKREFGFPLIRNHYPESMLLSKGSVNLSS
jgi:hypothetical protein